MEQDDGFCGCCGAIIDTDLIDAGSDEDPKTSPNLMAPDVDVGSGAEGSTERHAVLAAIDMGGFDERTDVAPPPLGELPPLPVELPPARVELPPPPLDLPPPPVEQQPPARPAPAPNAAIAPMPPAAKSEAPADDFQAFLEERTGAFPVDGAGIFEEETGTHRADRQAMVQPQVVLRPKTGFDAAVLSPFEQHVLSFLDGKRPLARLRKKAGLTFADLKVAIGMLADRGAIEVLGSFKPDVRGMLEEDDLADSGPHPTIPAAPPRPPPPPPQAPPRPSPMPLPGQGARPAVMPLPGQGGKPAAMPLPGQQAAPASAPAAPARPAPAAAKPAGPDQAARVQANLLLERALAEQRAGKRQAAIALMHMAAELLPGDPRIEELRRALMAR